MRRAFDKHGYATITGPGKTVEADTLTCKHCNAVWYIRSSQPGIKADPGGWCRNCMAPVCPKCAGLPCAPFLRRLEEYEQRMRLREAL